MSRIFRETLLILAVGDAFSLMRLSVRLSQRNKPYQMRAGSSLSLVDLRSAPAVLVGAFNNEWTMSLTGELRYYLELDAANSLELVATASIPAAANGPSQTPGRSGRFRPTTPLLPVSSTPPPSAQ